MAKAVIELLCLVEFRSVKVWYTELQDISRRTKRPLPKSTIDSVLQQCTTEVSEAL